MKFILICCTFLLLLKAKEVTAQIRVAKWNASGASLGCIGFSFEKVYKKQYSWQLGANFRPSMSGPKTFLDRSNEGFSFEEGSAQHFGLHLGLRFYTERARRMETKPYFGLFSIAQLTRFESTHLGPLKNDENGAYTIDVDWRRMGFGIEYGVQWIIKKRWSIDWTILGFGLSFNQVSSELLDLEEINVGRFESILSNTPFVGSHLLYKRNEDQLLAESTFLGIVPRAGLKIGLLF